jgi:hypothetical protein
LQAHRAVLPVVVIMTLRLRVRVGRR